MFVTAYDQYAISAFETGAIDYLLKPVEDERLTVALDRVRRELSTRDADEHRARLLRLLGTISGRPDLTLDEALADADRNGGRTADDRLAIKDSGRILPEFGGMLDMVDSFLLEGPVAMLGTMILLILFKGS